MSITQQIEPAFEAAPLVIRLKLISDVRRLSGLARDEFEAGLRQLWATGLWSLDPVHSAMRLGLSAEQCDGHRCHSTRFVWIGKR